MSIVGNDRVAYQASIKEKFSERDNKPHQGAENGTTPQCSGSDRINYGMIPLDDLDWAANQKPAPAQLFLECWRSDPYGTRWMQLNTKLKKTAFTEAKSRLSQHGLFIFKPEPSIQDGRSNVCWMVKNLHGSRVKEFWKEFRDTNSNPSATDFEFADTNHKSGITNLEFADTKLEFANTNSISPQTQSQRGVQEPSISFQYPIGSISSSISAREREQREEETEIFQKTEEEATQRDAIRPEGTSKPEPVVNTEGDSTPQSPASFVNQPEPIDEPKDLDREEYSGAASANENQSQATEDAALLKWLVEIKLPSMELNEAPRNPEAYAKAMIRRDGDALREEFAEVVRSSQFKEECAALTEKLELVVEDWRQSGIQLSVYYAFDGRPQVLLDGATIAAGDFLNMPIGMKPHVQPISAFINPEHAQNRKARQSRLRTAAIIGECPGFEFLVECWEDVVLRSQVKSLVAKYPQWGFNFP